MCGKYLYLVFSVFYLYASCIKKHKATNLPSQNIVEIVPSIGKIIPDSNLAPPSIVKAKNIKKVTAGKPVIIPYSTNTEPAIAVKSTTANLMVNSSEHNFEKPVIKEAINHPVMAGVPEIVVTKEPGFNDNNPANFSSFKSLQGLRQPLIRCMMQDADGNLWLGTYSGGISKYDGKYFTNYTITQGLSNDGVWSMIQDESGNIWMGTLGGGLVKFDGYSFTSYKTTEGLCDNNVYSICEDDKKKLWIGTKKGLSCYNGKTFTNYYSSQGLPDEVIHSVIQDQKGKIWIGTNHGAAFIFNDTIKTFAEKEGFTNSPVNTILGGNENTIWFGTDDGLFKSDGSQYFAIGTKEKAPARIMSLAKDRFSNLWIGTLGDGIYKFNGKEFTRYTTQEGLSNNKVTSLLCDKSGILWLGTNGGGICKYNGNLFTHFTTQQGLAYNEVKGITSDKTGNLWFATWGGGLSRFDGKSFQNYTVTQGLKSNSLLSILRDSKENLWLGGDNGACMFDGKNFTWYDTSQGFTNYQVWNIQEDKQHNIWFATFGDGVYKYDGSTFTHYSIKQGIANPVVMCLLQDHTGNFWFGTYGNGLYKYDGKKLTNYNHAGGLSSDEVMDMAEDSKGNLWIGTIGGGVNKYDGRNFYHYSTAQGLSNEIVMGILEDRKGNQWFSTRNGLNRMMPFKHTITTEENKLRPLFKNYLFEDGLLGVNTYVYALHEDKENNIWIGTSDRLTRCTPAGEIPDTIPPVVKLMNVSMYNERINWQELLNKKDITLMLANGVKVTNVRFDSISKWYNVPVHLSLAHDNNYLVFNYIGIATQSSYDIKYQYKMEGIDKNWNAVTDRTDAAYGNIPYGKYTFKVKAMNSEGYWSNEYSYYFEIRPAWWQTWWFKILSAIIIVSSGYAIYRYRLQQIIRLQNIRNRIASDLHDDIGSTLNSISVYSEVAKKDSSRQAYALSMIGESSRKVIDAMSDIVWTINPDNDSFEKIILRLRSLSYNLLRAKNIEFTFKVDEGLKDIKLSLEARRNFYLIFKEVLNNLIKYSGAKRASIIITRNSNTITLLIRDDGIGFDTGKSYNGNGLTNMRKRAKEIKANLTIESGEDAGTFIQLTLKP